jgi:hypothetical protein
LGIRYFMLMLRQARLDACPPRLSLAMAGRPLECSRRGTATIKFYLSVYALNGHVIGFCISVFYFLPSFVECEAYSSGVSRKKYIFPLRPLCLKRSGR